MNIKDLEDELGKHPYYVMQSLKAAITTLQTLNADGSVISDLELVYELLRDAMESE